jgi:hypothetical protein
MADSRTIINQYIEVANDPGTLPAVDALTYKSLDRLSKAVGLPSIAALKTWMSSDAFKPGYEELYDAVIKGRSGQGPALEIVQKALQNGENHGNRRFSRVRVDKSNFSEVDHYALCLYRLREENARGRDGIFKNYELTETDMEKRLWHTMLRATWDRAPTQSSGEKLKRNAGDDLLKTAQMNASRKATKTSEGESASKQRVDEGDTTDDLPDKATEDSITSTETTPLSVVEKPTQPAEETTLLPTLVEPSQPTPSSEDTTSNTPSRQPTPPTEETTSTTPSDDNIALRSMSDLDRIRSQCDRTNPFNLKTACGKYLTIYAVAQHFKNSFIMRRLTDALARQVTHEVYDESEDWHQLLETRSGKNRFQIQEPSAAEKRQKEEIERWFDNPAYQPMDFADACRLLDIDDPLYPRVHGQSFSVFLSPWQVTGIVQMVRFQMDETIRSCVLADATGLGKTFQILGHFLYVSTGSLRRAL